MQLRLLDLRQDNDELTGCREQSSQGTGLFGHTGTSPCTPESEHKLAALDSNTHRSLTSSLRNAKSPAAGKQRRVVLNQVDFQAIAERSTGGNGLPRPFGSFSAARGGNGLATWWRVPAEFRSSKHLQSPSPCSVAAADATARNPGAGRNISLINVQVRPGVCGCVPIK